MTVRRLKKQGSLASNFRFVLFSGGFALLLGLFLAFRGSSPSWQRSVLGASSLVAKGGGDSGESSSEGSDSEVGGSESDDDSEGRDDEDDSPGFEDSDDESNQLEDDDTGSFSSPIPASSDDDVEIEDDNSSFEIQDEDEEKIEVRLSDDERVRVRTKDGLTRVDLTSGGVKTRLEYRDGRVVVKVEQEGEDEVELADETLLEIEDRLSDSRIRIATGSGEQFVVARGDVGAITDFPLSIDLATNELSVTTSAGLRRVAILPDQAVRNLLVANIISRVGGLAFSNEVRSGTAVGVDQVVFFGERNGISVYEIAGVSKQRLLGLIPVEINREVVMSAETGSVIEVQESLFNQVIDLLSL